MHVTHLSLSDFRSYATVELPLDGGVSALIGPNGQGKTNLVEAIGYVAALSSHRVPNDAPLVRIGAGRAVVRTAIARAGRDTLVELEIVPGSANRARINRAPVPRPREVLGMLRTVLFAPEDLSLVKGDPDGRRRFMDDLLVARAPRFAGVRAEVDKVLKQRNALLKSAGASMRAGRGDVRTLDVWDAHLATAGAELLAGRLHLVHLLQPLVEKAYLDVSGGQGVARIDYRSSLGEDVTVDLPPADRHRDLLAARLLEALARVRPRELERGVSLVGPHRDDLVLSLDFGGSSVGAGAITGAGGSTMIVPAKGYASHGESWSYALALRLASYELLRADTSGDGDGEPVLILDDVFAELDAGRRTRLAELVAGAEQVLITAAVPDDVPQLLEGARIDVMGGEVNRVR
ncbi:MAG: DNA replication/repair protein RecF [Kineosporiaceae bacterium]|nr:DNA replication/repair protein RecF [Kineosporiaceae bacterium]